MINMMVVNFTMRNNTGKLTSTLLPKLTRNPITKAIVVCNTPI